MADDAVHPIIQYIERQYDNFDLIDPHVFEHLDFDVDIQRDFIQTGVLDRLWDITTDTYRSRRFLMDFMDTVLDGRLWTEGVPFMRPRRLHFTWQSYALYQRPVMRTVYDALDLASTDEAYARLLLYNSDSGDDSQNPTILCYAVTLPHITPDWIQLLLDQDYDLVNLQLLDEPYAREDVEAAVMREMLYRARNNAFLSRLRLSMWARLMEWDPPTTVMHALHGGEFFAFSSTQRVHVDAWLSQNNSSAWLLRYLYGKCQLRSLIFPAEFESAFFRRINVFTPNVMCSLWVHIDTLLYAGIQDPNDYFPHLLDLFTMRLIGREQSAILLTLAWKRRQVEPLQDTRVRARFFQCIGYDPEIHGNDIGLVRRPQRLLRRLPSQ